jgi:hypothetical protein
MVDQHLYLETWEGDDSLTSTDTPAFRRISIFLAGVALGRAFGRTSSRCQLRVMIEFSISGGLHDQLLINTLKGG